MNFRHGMGRGEAYRGGGYGWHQQLEILILGVSFQPAESHDWDIRSSSRRAASSSRPSQTSFPPSILSSHTRTPCGRRAPRPGSGCCWPAWRPACSTASSPGAATPVPGGRPVPPRRTASPGYGPRPARCAGRRPAGWPPARPPAAMSAGKGGERGGGEEFRNYYMIINRARGQNPTHGPPATSSRPSCRTARQAHTTSSATIFLSSPHFTTNQPIPHHMDQALAGIRGPLDAGDDGGVRRVARHPLSQVLQGLAGVQLVGV